jgi:long-chain acyl-CoA synthetase
LNHPRTRLSVQVTTRRPSATGGETKMTKIVAATGPQYRWTRYFHPNTPPHLAPPAERNLARMIAGPAARFADRLAYTCCLPNGMNGRLTFGEVDAASDDFAVWLREVAGLAAGDRVAVQMPNCLAYPVAVFGIVKAGCILVNTNPLYTADEMVKQFADARIRVLVVIDLFADKLPAVLGRVSIEKIVLVKLTEFFPSLVGGAVRAIQKYWNKQIPEPTIAHVRWDEALAAGAAKKRSAGIDVPRYSADLDPDDTVALQYTGGTTGVAKGAMLTHANLMWNCTQIAATSAGRIAEGEECVLTAIPLYHILAFSGNMMAFWNAGGHNVLIPNPRPLTNLKRAFENYRITWLIGVNTLFNGLNNEFWFQEYPPQHLKGVIAGGMALQSAVAQRWEALTGVPIVEGYGMTESSPVLTFNPFGRAKADSIGIPVPSTELKCVDDAGVEVPAGQPGEIIARGPQVMKGYWEKPAETANTLKDGWLYTGDIGIEDAEGYFKIVDRKKDMIIVSGFNVYPNELEECLAKLPGVAECAVIGVPEIGAGEVPKAFIVKRDPALTAEAVKAYCREHLTGYKVPKYVEFRDELPKTPVGKILRKDLRNEALARGRQAA